MQRAGPPPGSFPLLAERLPIPFQCFPYGFPILRRRLHDYFFGLLLDEPRRHRSQLFRVAAKHPPLKSVFAFDFNVGHNYSQHLLVDINSGYLAGHSFLLAGSGGRAAITLTRVAGYRCSPGEDNDAQLFAQTRTLRIRQMDGLEISIDKLDLAAPDRGILSLRNFHSVSRAEGPNFFFQAEDGIRDNCSVVLNCAYLHTRRPFMLDSP